MRFIKGIISHEKINQKNFLITVVLVLLIVCVIYIYDPFAAGNKAPLSLSSPHYKNVGLFKIDPATILSSLDQGRTDIFLEDSRLFHDRYDGPILYHNPVLWSQADNLKIVNALNQFVWNDNLEKWDLFRMVFNIDCQNNLNGLPGGIFTYFKTGFDKGKVIDTWREVEITPEFEFIAWGGSADFPHPFLGWKSVDLNRLNITAEEAVAIAEEHGGREARLSVENNCNIHLLLMPQRYRGWKVEYQSTDFEIEIDPFTSEVIPERE